MDQEAFLFASMKTKNFLEGVTMDYRLELLRLKLDRRAVAVELGLTYSQLSSRISGFVPWGEEERRLQEIISREQARAENRAVAAQTGGIAA